MAELATAGAVPRGAHTPDEGEDEPGLDQLRDVAQLLRRHLL